MQNSSDSSDLNTLNITQFFVGAPSNDQIREFFLRQKRLADLKALENSPETSPELSESFEMYLKTRKQKVEDEKFKIMREDKGFVDSPRSTRVETLRSSEYRQSMNDYEAADNTMNRCDDDSFLAMEKICENTLHIANESEILMDLTSMDSPLTQRKSLKKLPTIVDESHLNDIEAPSFFNNSSMISPNKHSPLIEFNANRPSTIMEVSEMSNKTYQSSYRTAMTGTEASQYKTADGSLTLGNTLEEATSIRDDTNEVEEFIKIKMPKIRSFYNDASPNMTRDSLELTGKIHHTIDLTKDSLESSSGVELSYDNNEEEEGDGDKMNDTLEQIEYMLAQAQRIQDEKAAKIEPVTPKPINSKTPASAKRPQHKLATPAPGSASKYSPLIKFSPVVRNSPGDSAFKKPGPSATKNPPQPMYAHNKKFQHIVSPISRYIKHTPGLPFSTTARVLPGIGNNSPKQYNFRDSETFSNENDSMNRGEGAYKGSSLPFRAKTKSSAVTQVYEQRDMKKTPGGKQIQSLLTNTTPTVTVHQGHVKTRDGHVIFQNSLLNETALSEQSFADLSLISGDVSVQVVEGVKRSMK